MNSCCAEYVVVMLCVRGIIWATHKKECASYELPSYAMRRCSRTAIEGGLVPSASFFFQCLLIFSHLHHFQMQLISSVPIYDFGDCK